MLPCYDYGRRSVEIAMLLTYIREAVRSLYTAKQRTLLALIGISIAIGAVISLVSIGIIWGNEMLRKATAAGPDILQIDPPWNQEDGEDITVRDTFLLLNSSRTLAEAVPMISTYGTSFFNGQYWATYIVGTTSSYKTINKLRLKAGRFISSLDKNKYYIVIGSEVLEKPAFKNFKGDLLGSTVKINNRSCTVVGTLEDSTYDWHAKYSIIMPISTVTHLFNEKNISKITARMQPNVDFRVATKEIERYFKQRKNIEVMVKANEQRIEEIKEVTAMLTLLLGFISSISLLVGGVGIMNVMLTSVMDRRREIGILRAIGARQRDIRRQFLTEAVILCLIGGIMGAGIGILACYIVCSINEWTFFIPKLGLWLGLGVSSLVGIFFGFYPAHKAAKLDPITALRSE
ncbi:MAG: FtsX-like permease family protein [Candidatus Electrothrix sp. AW2]|nr:FtsX-like permease family protein [Candidatus Electrothrix gigas]MCI5193284.1 FtsX-like permease family protein [Candidatus Electrothrix gigas]MCI5225457.1 FtsX-like permease family protein [Candidatus Electrothrix gigas]